MVMDDTLGKRLPAQSIKDPGNLGVGERQADGTFMELGPEESPHGGTR
jgi:hypothetical protein